MKRIISTLIAMSIILGFTAAVQAEEWIDVGPAYMPLSDFQDLKVRVSDPNTLPQRVDSRQPEAMVDAGMAILSQSDYQLLSDLVSGRRSTESNPSFAREEMVDLGMVLLTQSELCSLQEKVQKGVLPGCVDRLKKFAYRLASRQ